MRILKFRAWDARNKRMLVPAGLYEDGVPFIRYNNGISAMPLNDYPVMQYTGLQDKEGKELYEGDIVRFKEEDGKLTVGEVRMGTKNVAWSFYLPKVGTGITVPMLNFIHGMLSLVPDYDFKVIGNIYANPELLKEEDAI